MPGSEPNRAASSASAIARPGDVTATDEIDLGDAAVLPGLVNAHTHLELSWLRGRIPETDGFPRLDWIRAQPCHATPGRPMTRSRGAVAQAIDEARTFGTAAVGDISNSLATTVPLVERDMAATIFHELIGFRSADASTNHAAMR